MQDKPAVRDINDFARYYVFIMSLRKSETKTTPVNPALVRAINRYLLVTTKIEKADLGLVFGGQRSAAARIERTVELWRAGMLNMIVVTGGVMRNTQTSEANVMTSMLVSQGVPRSKILMEDQATNTGENVQLSIEVLKREGLYQDIQSVICIGRFSSSRRYLMTLERHWPLVRKMLAAINYHEVDPMRWESNEALATEVLTEWGKIRPYLDADFIRELKLSTCPLELRQ